MEPQIIRNTYQDIYNAVDSISESTLLLLADKMYNDNDLEVVTNTKERYKNVSAYDMLVLSKEMYFEIDHKEKYLIRHLHTEDLDADCSTTDNLVNEIGKREIASYIDDNQGFEDLIYLYGDRNRLTFNYEILF
jgi:hypothetical protein